MNAGYRAITYDDQRACCIVGEVISAAGHAALEHMDQAYEARAASCSAAHALAEAWHVAASLPRGTVLEKAVRFAEEAVHASLLRDIFGNPFRSTTLEPSLLTPEIVALARTIYEQRALSRIPDLADALEAAGCMDAEVLGHLREPGPHVKGCWVVDLVLGKK